eukprot:8194794-Pyramimonas_sp.AAC.1
MGVDFNYLRKAFIPKGEEDGDPAGIIREASQTRPLGLKNAEVKVITAAVFWSLSVEIPNFVSKLQRGFVRGRNHGMNVIELDMYARVASMRECTPQALPAL